MALAGSKAKASALATAVRNAGYADISGDLVPGLTAVAVPADGVLRATLPPKVMDPVMSRA